MTAGPAAWHVYIQYRVLFRQWWKRIVAELYFWAQRRIGFNWRLGANDNDGTYIPYVAPPAFMAGFYQPGDPHPWY